MRGGGRVSGEGGGVRKIINRLLVVKNTVEQIMA